MKSQMYPCLWFDGQAKAAAEFYCSIFKNSKIVEQNQMVVTFELNGNKFMGLNGGPKYKFSPATSFVIECETQEDIDYYWNKLGVSWQIIPAVLHELMADADRSPRVILAFMKMSKFDIKTLLEA